jgi:class 3 adenylate cyclase
MDAPETRYTKSGDVHVAYQVFGHGDGVRSLGVEIRTGLHTGEVELADGGMRGIAVRTGARVAAEASLAEVLVCGTVRHLVAGSGIAFEDRGAHTLKGVPEPWHLFAVVVA